MKLIQKILPKGLRNFYRKLKRKLPDPTNNPVKDAQLYWSSSEKDKTTKIHSHWRGVGSFTESVWMDIGNFGEALLQKYFEREAPDYLKNSAQMQALEWGSGGGANMRMLCNKFEKCYGVDISKANLEECQRQMQAFSYQNFIPVFFDSEAPEQILEEIPEGSLDFILSTAVFQHFPSQEYSLRVLKIMHRLLKNDAYALIQTRYQGEKEELKPKNENYFENVISFTSFAEGEFEAQLKEAGFKKLISEKDIDLGRASANYTYFFIRKLK